MMNINDFHFFRFIWFRCYLATGTTMLFIFIIFVRDSEMGC